MRSLLARCQEFSLPRLPALCPGLEVVRNAVPVENSMSCEIHAPPINIVHCFRLSICLQLDHYIYYH